MAKRDFLQITDFSRRNRAALRPRQADEGSGLSRDPLAGKTLAMIFAKSSTRTASL